MHVWQNADRDGSRGWFWCERCGRYTTVVPADDGTLEPPPADLALLSRTGHNKTCDDLVEEQAVAIVNMVANMLDKAGANNPFRAPSAFVRQAAITKIVSLLKTYN